MAAAPIYVSRLSGEAAPALRPPGNDAGSTIGGALAGAGQAVGQLGAAIAAAGEDTRAAEATTNYVTRLADLEDRFKKDPDFQGASTNFAAERAALEDDVLGSASFSAATKAQLGLRFRQYGLSAQNGVDQASLTRNVGATNAALDAQEGPLFARVRAAGSPAERTAILGEWDASIDAPVRTGLIGLDQAEARKERRNSALDEADVLELVRNDPERAAATLGDPARFRYLSPGKREQYIGSAATAADAVAVDDLVSRARWKPETASLELGRVQDASHLAGIFDQGVIARESGGNNASISPKGALGVAQLLPGTARDMAKKLGLDDVAGLSDADMKARLLADPVLGRRLGLEYFGEQAAKYEGSVPLALAAYNAGPKEADRWKAAAEAKFGPNPSPAQILSVVDYKETRDYVANIYGRLGARMDVQLSPTAAFRAANGIGEVLDADARAKNQAIKDLAAVDRNENDPVDSLKEGFSTDPAGLANHKRVQAAAAAIGDRDAAAELRRVNEAEAAAPFIREAYGMAPADLDAAISTVEQRLAASPDVAGDETRRLKAFQAVRDEVRKRAADDPVGLAERAQIFRGVAIDPAGDFGAQREALASRGYQAEAAAAAYSGKLMPFRPAEAAALKDRWAAAGEAEKFSLLAGLAGTMGERPYRAAVQQMAGSDAIGATAGLIARDRPEVARMILHGAELLKNPAAEKPAQALRDAVKSKLGTDVYPGGDADVVNAAVAYYAATRGAAGTLADPEDERAVEAAIEAVAGASVSRNGKKFPAPPGMSAATAGDALDHLSGEDLAAAGGARDRSGRPFDPAELGRHAALRPLQPFGARYAVLIGDSPVLNDSGGPLVLDLDRIAAARSNRVRSGAEAPAIPDRLQRKAATERRWWEWAGGRGGAPQPAGGQPSAPVTTEDPGAAAAAAARRYRPPMVPR